MADHAADNADDDAWVEDDDTLVIEDPKKAVRYQGKSVWFHNTPVN